MHDPLLTHIRRYVALDADESALVVSLFEHRYLPKKTLLLAQGDLARHEAFVVSGCLKAFFTDQDDKEFIIRFATENWWIGDLDSFHNHRPATYAIEALEDSHLLLYTKAAEEILLTRIPRLETFFRILYRSGLIALQRRMMDAISQTADDRYADFVHRYPNLEQRIPQYLVASYLGITPQFLSQIRRKFASR